MLLQLEENSSMAHVLAVAMQKGGVAKTTTTLNVAAGLVRRERRVLAIDLDPQASLTQGFGIDPTAVEYSSYEVLFNPRQGVGFATVETNAGVDLIPATMQLSAAELALAGKVGRELLLQALKASRQAYDVILIDTPPSLGLYTLNALVAADSVLVPLQTHIYALKSMPYLEEAIELVRQLNPSLAISGIVCTFATNTVLSKGIEDRIRQEYGDLVFTTTIPNTIRLAEAPASGEDVVRYAPGSSAAIAYEQLCDEVEKRYAS
jgi:chromosome partitioning protein